MKGEMRVSAPGLFLSGPQPSPLMHPCPLTSVLPTSLPGSWEGLKSGESLGILPFLPPATLLLWSGRIRENVREMGIWLRMGPGLGLGEAHIGHDLELSYVDQFCGQ